MNEIDSNVSATALKALSVLDFIGEQRPAAVACSKSRRASAPTAPLPIAC